MTADFQKEPIVGRDGDPLPGVSKHQVTLVLDYNQQLNNGWEIQYHLDGSYRSSFQSRPNALLLEDGEGISLAPLRAHFAKFDGIAILNTSVALRVSQHWQFRAFVNNLTDEDGITGVFRGGGLPHSYLDFVGRPRTVGLGVNYQF